MGELSLEEIDAKSKEYDAMMAKLDAMADELIANGVEIKAEGKPWYMSKMFWANAFALGISGAYFFGVSPEIVATYVGVAVAVVNIYLRASAPAQPLTLK